MKINQSTVAMASERQAFSARATRITVSERFRGEDLLPDASKEAEKRAATAKGTEKETKKEAEKEAATLDISGKSKDWLKQGGTWEPEEDFKIKMLRRMLESLRAIQEGRMPDYRKLERMEKVRAGFHISSSKSFSLTAASGVSFGIAVNGTPNGAADKEMAPGRVTVGANGPWKEQVTMSSIFTEKEVTSFSTAGMVETADGRSISFNVNLEMSREFTSTFGMEYTRKVFCVDPLVINLEGSPAGFSDQTFFFDLNQDGKKEKLAQLSSGSGMLALDKNKDGSINDGGELFGTKSGDGFKDLAAYDEDGNGWIDESDNVFKDLKIWTRDADGKERLLAIGEAGVGAIYLGKAATEFSLKQQETNKTQGIIRSTGIFLKENGEAGTIQHVDMVI
ncbi:MAG: hypothetical protein UFG06_02650 [Lachnospiraceae bacterium]|nr:hypothetical protein [Lachnospiraceae bacterium]